MLLPRYQSLSSILDPGILVTSLQRQSSVELASLFLEDELEILA